MPEYRKKLIEVALPLEAISLAASNEKSIHVGLPANLHTWWSRKPLAACRAVLFAQMVDDPSSLPNEFPTEETQNIERLRLFSIIEELVQWENITNEIVLHKARVEIARSAARNHGVSLPREMSPAEVAEALKKYTPPVLDPFAGGGSIPLEAQRLGLEAHASDLNPVAVLITKALIEIPPKFVGRQPVNSESREKYLAREWKGTEGLAEDVRYYGKWMRSEAWKRIGHLYPKVQLPKEYGGGEATVIAWLWARTVTCPNPACGAQMPLTSKWALSMHKGREAWIVPVVNHEVKTVHFEVRRGTLNAQERTAVNAGTALINDKAKKVKATFRCVVCGVGVAAGKYIDNEANAGHMRLMPLAVVTEAIGGRIYLPFKQDQIEICDEAHRLLQERNIQEKLPTQPTRGTFASNAQGRIYGFKMFKDYFTSRQLVALTVFSDLVGEVLGHVIADTDGDAEYAEVVATYLALGISRCAQTNNTLVRWLTRTSGTSKGTPAFDRQMVSMVWEFSESNIFGSSVGSWLLALENLLSTFRNLPVKTTIGKAFQRDATTLLEPNIGWVISTDPPYFDNVSYADLSDFYYVWLRMALYKVYPDLFNTVLTPKQQELIAAPHRFDGDAVQAEKHFLTGLRKAFAAFVDTSSADYPITVYYAFKQNESNTDDSDGDAVVSSTGWETMLEGLLQSGFCIGGTWPVRTEQAARLNAVGANALASSIVLVCRPRPLDAPLTTRRDFLQALKRELPKALRDLQRGNIAPVDLAQAAIGPGMAIFSRYSKVLESDGSPMRVRTALQLINQTLDEVLAEQEGEYDADTRWAIAWFEQFGMEEGPYGVAETLSKAKNTAVGALVEAGILRAQGGKVRLLRRNEFSGDWNPYKVKRLTAWEVTQRLIQALQERGETGAATILDHVGAYGEVARDLAYRLYTVCERKKWVDEALAYNSLVVEWSDIGGTVEQLRRTTAEQARLFS